MNTIIKSLAIASLITTSTISYADVENVIEKSFSLGDSPSISLSNVNGNVVVTNCNCSDVTVIATISADTQEALETISVEMSSTGSRLYVESEYERRNWNGSNGKRKVNYELSVPPETNIDDFDLVNGNLAISDISGKLHVSLVNGDLESNSSHKKIEVDTVNGAVDINIDETSNLQMVEIASVNGSVRLTLPTDIDADVEATTVNGSIRNDFGLTVNKGRYVGRSMRGVIGNGGIEIDLSNVNGSINLKR